MAAGNSVNDEIREQQAKLKDKTPKEKWEYFWHYYKWHTIGGIALIIALGNLVWTIATQKDTALSVAMVNTYFKEEVDADAMAEDFEIYAEVDQDQAEVVIDTDMHISYDTNAAATEINYANTQKLMAMTAAASIDVILADDTYIEHNMESGIFWDLSELLPAETLEKYADRIKYADLPDDDKGEVPYCIDVRDSKYMFSDQLSTWFCVTGNAPNIDNVVLFLDYLLAE